MDGPFNEAPWVGPLIDLGVRASRFCTDGNHLSASDQLFIAITVPTRVIASSLIAVGWLMASSPATAVDTLERLRSTPAGTLIRMVTNKWIILHKLVSFDGNRVQVDTKFESRVVAAVTSVTDGRAKPCRTKLPPVPVLGPWSNTPSLWPRYLCQPPDGLAIIGAKSRVLEDLKTYLAVPNQTIPPTQLRDLVLPREGRVATWATDLVPPSTLPEDPDEAPQYSAVILDGAPAIRAADRVDAGLVVAVVDRSVMDDSAAEDIVQRRNTRGVSVNILTELGWRPPTGVEAVAFRTRRW